MELSVDQRDLLVERLAQKIYSCGLTAPAILFLEANKPFSFIGSQALLFFQPLLGFLLGDEVIGVQLLSLINPAEVTAPLSRGNLWVLRA